MNVERNIFFQKHMFVSLFSYISSLLIDHIIHADAGQYTGQRKSIALIDPHVSLFSVTLNVNSISGGIKPFQNTNCKQIIFLVIHCHTHTPLTLV